MKIPLVGILLALVGACAADPAASKRSSKEPRKTGATSQPGPAQRAEDDADSEPSDTESDETESASSDDDDEEEGDETKPSNHEKTKKDEPKTVDADITFLMLYGAAADKNCVSLQFNGQAAVAFGCNTDGGSAFNPPTPVTKTVSLRAKPFCNVLRIIDRNESRSTSLSTENAAQVKWGKEQSIANFAGMRVFESDPGTIVTQINDNGDANDYVDVHFQIVGLKNFDFAVEHGGGGCTPL